MGEHTDQRISDCENLPARFRVPDDESVSGSSKCRIRNLMLAVTIVAALTGGCATLPENADRTVSSAHSNTEDTTLGRDFAKELAKHPGLSGFILLENGLEAFVARAALAEAAEVGIDAQYYLLHDDLTGKLFLNELIKAADRGVRVRLLLDDMDLSGRDLTAALIDEHPNSRFGYSIRSVAVRSGRRNS